MIEKEKKLVDLWVVLLIGACVRFLLALTGVSCYLQDRNELSTPLTSWRRLKEGSYLSVALSQNPYQGGWFHHPPLALLLPIDEVISHILWTLTEVGTAYLLARIAGSRSRGKISTQDGESNWTDSSVAALYLLHPFSMGTSLARSSAVLNNFFVVLAIFAAMEENTLPSAFALSLATHCSLYPALLVPPLALLCHQRTHDSHILKAMLAFAFAFVTHQAVVLLLSAWMTGSWDFLGSVYGVMFVIPLFASELDLRAIRSDVLLGVFDHRLTFPDLTPNIGVGWYFFIEMFDHFRSFFVGVFQLHVMIYVVPFTIAYQDDPLFAVVLMTGVTAMLKSYPSLADFSLWYGLLATYSELAAHLGRPFFLLCLATYALFLLPTFHHLWLYSGSGNANFFYASTLVWAISQGGLMFDVMSARGRRQVLLNLEEKAGIDEDDVRRKVREGEWVIVQR